jgi:hypothetical protein
MNAGQAGRSISAVRSYVYTSSIPIHKQIDVGCCRLVAGGPRKQIDRCAAAFSACWNEQDAWHKYLFSIISPPADAHCERASASIIYQPQTFQTVRFRQAQHLPHTQQLLDK